MLKWNFNHLKFNERLSAAQTWPSPRNRWQIPVDSPHFGGNLGRQLLLTIAAAIVVVVSCRRRHSNHHHHHQQQKRQPSLGSKMELMLPLTDCRQCMDAWPAPKMLTAFSTCNAVVISSGGHSFPRHSRSYSLQFKYSICKSLEV
jgi:hypothetical protein